MSYVLKEKPEDFKVTELIDFDFQENGRFTYFLLEKIDVSTPEAIRRIANDLGVHVKKISYAGLKDRRAVTSQLCSVEGVFPKKIEQLEIKGLTLTFKGFSDRPLGRGMLKGNHFDIVLRNLDHDVKAETKDEISYPNYFGTQRFLGDNVTIGRFLLQKNFTEAARLISESRGIVLVDPITTVKRVPRKELTIYIHSYQSYLFNETLKHFIDNGLEVPSHIPLVGFGTEDIPEFMQQILDEDKITTRSFIFRKIPLLSSEGGRRNSYCTVSDLNISDSEEDECYSSKKKVLISFDLPRGSYATEFISHLYVHLFSQKSHEE